MFEKAAEEKAEEYANKNVPIYTSFGFRSLYDAHYDVKQAFLAGFEYNNKQLTKAKEIIKNLVDSLIAIDGEQIKELKTVKEAKQYLKEA